ncbi:hypothetical protein E5226_16260, partial [Cellulomonas shaoxiangyii]
MDASPDEPAPPRGAAAARPAPAPAPAPIATAREHRLSWSGLTGRAGGDGTVAVPSSYQERDDDAPVRRTTGSRRAVVVCLVGVLTLAGVATSWALVRDARTATADASANRSAPWPSTSRTTAPVAAGARFIAVRDALAAAVTDGELVWSASAGVVDETLRTRLRTALDDAARVGDDASDPGPPGGTAAAARLAGVGEVLLAETAAVRSAMPITGPPPPAAVAPGMEAPPDAPARPRRGGAAGVPVGGDAPPAPVAPVAPGA